ncbi:SHOCT domain-containing protein [Streptomyces sp. ID05-39B]|uniref:SHOCT domain-containing protein n=1 Tax=Streptomyces sp. ID05-39B TaxID=3028664 RepID=UPI0029B14BD9|nr:SHOCT domain-containing protein [Streptomyces sp. ID05-39B]MDX3531672.1 SHOCT domain-containing protein [Streptomyces sp. ID05-39B]
MDDYPLLNLFWTMLWLFLWVMWFFLLFKVITDIFRDHTLSGWAKAGWLVFTLVLPYLGVLVYLGVRGRSMAERDVQQAREQERAVRQYIQKTAGTGSGSVDELHKLSTLRDKGDLSQEEFEKAKTKLLA